MRKVSKRSLLKINKKAKKPTDIDSEVVRLIEKISEKYDSVWRELAKR